MEQGPVRELHRALVLFERIIKKEERIMVVDRGAFAPLRRYWVGCCLKMSGKQKGRCRAWSPDRAGGDCTSQILRYNVILYVEVHSEGISPYRIFIG